MKSDVVVGDCRWNHEFMLGLLLSYVVDENPCLGWRKLWYLMNFWWNGLKGRKMILKFLNGLMVLLGWVRVPRNFVFHY